MSLVIFAAPHTPRKWILSLLTFGYRNHIAIEIRQMLRIGLGWLNDASITETAMLDSLSLVTADHGHPDVARSFDVIVETRPPRCVKGDN